MADMTFIHAWRREDPKVAADVRAFWTALGLSAEECERRLAELCVVVYVDGELAGVSTAVPTYWLPLRATFANLRCAVAPAFRRHDLAARILSHARIVLEAWSAAHPEERLMGYGVVLQSAELRDKQREPLWPYLGVDLTLVGYNERGEQMRVCWFNHARLDETAP
jgi:GNAT superfamily N-acetyltransferase